MESYWDLRTEIGNKNNSDHTQHLIVDEFNPELLGSDEVSQMNPLLKERMQKSLILISVKERYRCNTITGESLMI